MLHLIKNVRHDVKCNYWHECDIIDTDVKYNKLPDA